MSEGVLYLGGGGDSDVSAPFDAHYLAQLKDGARIFYLPVARNAKKVGREWFGDFLTMHKAPARGITFHIQREEEPLADVNDFDAIYIGGGNTFKLLEYVYKNGLDGAFKDFIKMGRPIFGGSAGAIIFGKSINTADSERESYTREDGLNLLNGVSIDCHYETANNAAIATVRQKLGHDVLAIPENGGLIYNNARELLKSVGAVVRFGEDLTVQGL